MIEQVSSSALRHEWQLSVPPDDVDTALDFLRAIWAYDPAVTMEDRSAIETAVVELTGNVIEHAAKQTPGLVCHVVVTLDASAVQVEVRDAGSAVMADISGTAMPDDAAESGRGIPMIRALVDEFIYERRDGVNRWRLVRRRRDAQP